MVNSWNIKDPLGYKLNLQQEYAPDFWQWIQGGQIIYSESGNLAIFFDQEVVKTFSQDEERIKANSEKFGNMNKQSKWRKSGWIAQGNKLYITIYQKNTKKSRKLNLKYDTSEMSIDTDADKLVFIHQHVEHGFYVFALYDTQRVVFIQIDEKSLFGEEMAPRWPGSQQSVISGGSVGMGSMSGSMLSIPQSQKAMKKQKGLKTKVVYFDDIL